MRQSRAKRGLILIALVLGFTQFQCLLIPDDTEKGERVENKQPSVRITAGAATSDPSGIDSKVLFRWNGFDEDGVISEYQFAVDDTISENAWQDTTGFSALIRFQAATQDPRDASGTRFTDWHTFYIRAVDNEFSVSEADFRFFNARTIAPTSRITFPIVVGDTPQLQRTLVLRWDGDDLDSSQPEQKPVAYEYKLVRIGEPFDPDFVIVDSLRNANNLLLDTLRVGSKKAWVRAPAGEQEIRLEDLPVASRLAFGVRAIDEAGALEPHLARGRNFIAFAVTGNQGRPSVLMTEASVGSHSFPGEGDTWEIFVPTDRPIRFKWLGDATSYGSLAGNVNYALDIPDVEDESIRDPEGIGGWIGWGTWEELQRPLVFSTQEGGTQHNFWLKMRDISDSKESERLCQVIINVVGFTFERFALIVDDARFQANPRDLPHDDFLDATILRRFYDLGGVDKFSTYGGSNENAPKPEESLGLSTLAKYRHVVWHSQAIALGQILPLYTHEVIGGKLSSYLAAGGRLMMTGGRLSSHVVGTRSDGHFLYPKRHPDDALNPGYDKDTFIWTAMRMRNTIVSLPTGGSSTERESSGLIAARSVHPAYPDLRLDREKWDPMVVINNESRFRSGISIWEGVLGEFLPIERMEGLDSLYTAVTMDTTFCCGPRTSGFANAVVGHRYQSTRIDTLLGTQQGRTVVLGFQPWYFEESTLTDAGTAAINWLVTGKDH